MKTIRRVLSHSIGSFFLFGPRGTGKSTWLRHEYSDACFIDLLSDDVYRRLLAHPERLREIVGGNADKRVFVIDEVQRCPSLLNTVHQLMEEDKRLCFVLTGSSARKLKRSGVDLLAGRATLRTCHPFLATELGSEFSLTRALQNGLLPLVVSSENPEETLRAYLGLYMREEIQMEGLVRNIAGFSRFLEAISFSHGALLSVADIARECEVSRTTVNDYISILEDLLLATKLPVFSKRAKRQLVAHGKFYFFDAGVFRAVRPAGPLDRSEEIDGAALEGLVFQHLRAWNDYSGSRNTLGFWRTKAGVEVDFVVYGPKTFAAVEVKNSGKIKSGDLGGLSAFAEDYPEAQRFLLYRGKERLLIDGVQCIPCDAFLKALRPCEPLPT